MFISLHVKKAYPLLLTDCNETRIFSTDFQKILEYKISRKAVQWKPICSMRMDGQAEGHDEVNSDFFVILRMAWTNRTPYRLFSLHSETVSRKQQSTDETIFWSLKHHIPRIRAGRSGVRFSEAARDTSLLENEETNCEAQPDFHSVGTGRYPIPRVQRPRR